MRKTYKGIYVKEILKVCFFTVFMLALIICILWGCLFATDYMMVKNDKPTVFTSSHVEQTENGKVVYEDGLFYHIVTSEEQVRTLYLFNKEMKVK